MAEPIADFRRPQPYINKVSIDRPWHWLVDGWYDMRVAPFISLTYGLTLAAAGWVAVSLLLIFDLPYLVLPLGAGFFFVGPFIAVGLYEISRRIEGGHVPTSRDAVFAYRRNSGQIALMGLLLLFFHLAWMRLAQLLFALFGWGAVPTWDRFVDIIWYSSRSLPFLGLGVGLGAILAACSFTIGAFSIPYLVDRPHSNLFEAVATSVSVVRHNPKPMLLWACLIVFLTVLGMIPGLIGLIVTLPVVAHATWHAYDEIVRFDEGDEP